jgi:heat shock protein HslJ
MKKFAYLTVAALAPALLAQPVLAQKKPPAQQEGEKQDAKKDDKYKYEPQFPTKMNWILSTANGKAPPVEATMSIDENLRGTGNSGCNAWSATLYPVRGQKLMMGPVAMTKKTCPAEQTALERMFLSVLHTGPTWELVGSTLTIKSQAGTLVFNRGL